MKRSLLLVSAISLSIAASAQSTRVMQPEHVVEQSAKMNPTVAKKGLNEINKYYHDYNAIHGTRGKGTTATSRWYSYGYYYDSMLANTSTYGADLALGQIWRDTSATWPDGSHNTFVSMGTGFDPVFRGFIDPTYYDTMTPVQVVSRSDNYTIDSVAVWGLYFFNPAKSSVRDTIKLTLCHGNDFTTNGVGLTGFPGATNTWISSFGLSSTDTLISTILSYDSTVNVPTGTGVQTFNIIPSFGDTLSNGFFYKVIPVTVNVTSGEIVGAAETFHTGDAAYRANDSVFGVANTVFNVYRPLLSYKLQNASTRAADFPTYTRGDYNQGQFKRLPNFSNGWGDIHVPEWAWSTSAGGSSLQNVFIDFHVTCNTCRLTNTEISNVYNTIGNVNAFPVPANNELTVSFDLKATADVQVIVSNINGKVIGVQNVNNAKAGQVTFNTSNFATGTYLYTIVANGERMTNRVTVAH